MPKTSDGLAQATTSAGFPGDVVQAWYGWVPWLPSPWRVVSLVIAAWIVIKLFLRYGMRPLTAVGAGLARSLLYMGTWLAVTPEYAITSLSVRSWGRNPPGSFTYGEAVAGLVEVGERGVSRFSTFLGRSRRASGKVAFWSVLIVLVLVNLLTYTAHGVWPVVIWWHSLTAWVHSLQHHASGRQQAPPTTHHHHHHHHRHRQH